MTVEEQVRNLSRSEKLMLMESLWTDLSTDDFESPPWHETALRDTERRRESGEDSSVNWEDAKRQLREE